MAPGPANATQHVLHRPSPATGEVVVLGWGPDVGTFKRGALDSAFQDFHQRPRPLRASINLMLAEAAVRRLGKAIYWGIVVRKSLGEDDDRKRRVLIAKLSQHVGARRTTIPAPGVCGSVEVKQHDIGLLTNDAPFRVTVISFTHDVHTKFCQVRLQ